jgi:hypothetical protein
VLLLFGCTAAVVCSALAAATAQRITHAYAWVLVASLLVIDYNTCVHLACVLYVLRGRLQHARRVLATIAVRQVAMFRPIRLHFACVLL